MNLNKISLGLSIGGVLFAFYGMLKMVLYYNYFYIEILYFVNFSDLINASLEGIAVLFLLFFPVCVATLSLINRKKILEGQSLNSFREFWKQQRLFVIIATLLFLGSMVFMIHYLWIARVYIRDSFPFPNVCLVLLILAPVFTPKALDVCAILVGAKPFSFLKKLVAVLMVYLSILYISSAYIDVSAIMKDKYFMATDIYLNDGTVLYGDSTRSYIGNTSQYLFFYDSLEVTTTMYPMSDVKKIDF